MKNEVPRLSGEVTTFLDGLNHPLRKEMELLRTGILAAQCGLVENIKWNGPNYSFKNEDRITMRIQPPKQLQLIFHRGAKKQQQPKDKLISDPSGILSWKENDRAVATFKSLKEIESRKTDLAMIVRGWISAAI